MFNRIEKLRRFHFVNLAIVALWIMSVAPVANAGTSFGALGGVSLGGGNGFSGYTNPSVLLGGEVLFGFSGQLEVGGVYNANILDVAGLDRTGTMHFFGAMLRFMIPGAINVFADGELGAQAVSVGGVSNSDFALGFGVGSKLSVGPTFEIRPRVGLRFVPGTPSMTLFGVSLGFAFVIPS